MVKKNGAFQRNKWIVYLIQAMFHPDVASWSGTFPTFVVSDITRHLHVHFESTIADAWSQLALESDKFNFAWIEDQVDRRPSA